MNSIRCYPLAAIGAIAGVGTIFSANLPWSTVLAQDVYVTLATGFSPNPTVLTGTGGGNRRAEDIVNQRNTPTGPCLGYISTRPNEEVTLQNRFSNLEMRVESALDTTLIIEGPDRVWCNDDYQGQNPAIVGEWLPGRYRVWIGAYRPDESPSYQLFINDKS